MRAPRIVNQLRPLAKRLPGAAGLYFLLSPTARRNALDERRFRLLLTQTLREDSNCIDVGAHSGELTAHIVRVAPEGQHILFEPLPELAESLRRRFPRLDVRQAAVSDHTGEATFVLFRDRLAWSGLKKREGHVHSRSETMTVPVVRLDDALPGDYVPTLIKIDVEGAERQVIEGGMQTLSRHRPIVVFEHSKTGAPYFDTQPHDVYELLVNVLSMRIFDLDGKGPLDLDTFRAAFESGRRTNFLARP